MPSTLINNQWREGRGNELISTTPDERRILWQKNASSERQVQEAIASAHAAQDSWAARRLDDRVEIINRFADTLKQRREQLAADLSLETGKPRWEALTEISAMTNKVAISIRAQQERAGDHQGDILSLSHHPHGVMAVFGPFNFPGHLPNGHIVPALLAGNTVIFKPSELTPHVAELTARIWLEAGLPAGVLNLVQGGREVGEALVTGRVDGILFTGSNHTGRKIHQRLAGRPEVLLALEMGGNNPLIVGDVSNLDVAANTILHSAFLSAGQRCTCARRLILVQSDNDDALLDKLIAVSRRVIVGRGDDAFMGPVINVATAEKLLSAQQALLASGARALLAMTPGDNSPVYLSPGILEMSAATDVRDEELFGPLLQVYRAKDFAAALQLANTTRFGLAAGLLSDSQAEQELFKQQIRAGVVSINAPTAGASSELPFGGIGASGNHRPSAYYAADYCAWPQATTQGGATGTQADTFDGNTIRGLR